MKCVCGRPEQQRSARGRGAWAGVSAAGIALSCAVAVTFPFFSTVTAVVAALGDLAGAYTLPALFVLVRAAPPCIPRVLPWAQRLVLPDHQAYLVSGVLWPLRPHVLTRL